MLSRGRRFMEHQRYMTDVAFELDPATGLLWYDTVVVVIMRQNGKTTVVEAVLVFHTQRAPFLQLIYSAQNADKAREKLIDEFYEQRLRPVAPYFGGWKPRKSNGSAHLRCLGNGSKIFVVPNNETAADSKTVAAGAIDEAFSHKDLTMIGSVQPTMVTLDDPQLLITSTRGHGDDGLLMHYEDVGVAAVHDPDSRLAYFEWSAGPEDDCSDPATWRRIMPALGQTITEERLHSYRATMDPAEFDRGFCNRRPIASVAAAINLEHWSHAARGDVESAPLELEAPLTAAVHVHPVRTHTSIAVAGQVRDDPGAVGVLVDRRPGTGWVVEALEQLVARHCEVIVADRVAGAGGIIDRAAGRGVLVEELTGTDVANHLGTFVDQLEEHTLRHNDQTMLNDAVNGSRDRPLGGTRALDQRTSTAPIDPLQAATFAVGAHLRRYPAGAVVERIR